MECADLAGVEGYIVQSEGRVGGGQVMVMLNTWLVVICTDWGQHDGVC